MAWLPISGAGRKTILMLKTLAILVLTSWVTTMAGAVLPAFAAQESDASGKAAVAYAARLVGDKTRARLIVDFDAPVTHRATLLKDPMRVVIDLSKTVFSLNEDASQVPDSIVEALRFGVFDQGTSRIVLPLSSPALIDSRKLKPLNDKKRHRLIVDLLATDEPTFQKAAVAEVKKPVVAKVQKPKPEKPKKVETKQPERKFLIVLDPGHGGIDYGAAGQRGTQEKDVTLEFSRRLAAELEKNPRYRVSLTRKEDKFVSLTERLEFARDQKADLMISIHADSLRQRNIRGATIYTLSKKGSDSLSRQLAQSQNRSDLIAGLSLPKLEAPVNDILIDLTRRETEVFSKRIAQALVQSMRKAARLIRNPHRSADFFVLKAPEVPSVLLELGYLSNKRDEKLLASDKWQQMMAGRVKLAIDTFFAPRMAAKP